MVQRRSKISIAVDILKLIQSKEKGVKPTHIMYGANLSYKRLQEQLDDLLEKKLINKKEGKGEKSIYTITREGMKFLEEFRKMEKLMEAFGMEI